MVFRREKPWKWKDDNLQVIRSIARTGPGCHQGCGVLLSVKDGKLVKVEGDPEFPHNQGRLCPRCLALTQLVYHPDRLRYPLKRAGNKGEGKLPHRKQGGGRKAFGAYLPAKLMHLAGNLNPVIYLNA